MQLTRTSDKLKRTIRFNAERGDVPFIAPMDSDYFSLILIKNGAGSVTVRTGTGEAATFSINTPMAICLRDQESLTFSMTDGDVYNLVFSPTFINVNMRPAVLEQVRAGTLSAGHARAVLSLKTEKQHKVVLIISCLK